MSNFTEKLLASSLKKQMQTKKLEKITINDIVLDCQMNRRTFYYHFHDIYDLVEWIFRTEITEALNIGKEAQTWQNGFLAIFKYLRENRRLVVNAYNSEVRDYLENHLYNEICVLIIEVVNEFSGNLQVTEEERMFIIKFFKLAFIGIVIDWIKNNMKEEPEKIIAHFDKIISSDIYRTLMER
jgi:probable dihydroxyacetone kinase regulator